MIPNRSIATDNETTSAFNGTRTNDYNNYKELILKLYTVLMCLSVLGIVGNVFSLTVWCMETSFNTTVFLFKVLAVVDIMYLASVMGFHFVIAICDNCAYLYNGVFLTAAIHLSYWTQIMSVHVTLLIAVSRWIAVTFPFHARKLMTSRRIYLSCALVLTYCGLFASGHVLYDIYTEYHVYKKNHQKVLNLYKTVGLVLPLFLLLAFNITLLWTATRRPSIVSPYERKKTQFSTNIGLQLEKIKPQGSAGVVHHSKELTGHEHETHERTGVKTREDQPQQTALQSQWQQYSESVDDSVLKSQTDISDHFVQTCTQRLQKRHMVFGVLLVSVCCFIAYGVGTSLQIYLSRSAINITKRNTLRYVIIFCKVFNSSINVFIYWFFVSRFRRLVSVLRDRLCACFHRPRDST